jgi:hypothetical protein
MADDRKELFSEKVSAGVRTYFFDIRETKDGSQYLVISESKKTDQGYEHMRVMVFEEHAMAFAKGLENALSHLGEELEPERQAHKLDDIRKNHPRAYEKWAPEEDARLKSLHGLKKSIPEIAALLHRQPGAIRSRLEKLGLK